jgi:hypothetical protein
MGRGYSTFCSTELTDQKIQFEEHHDGHWSEGLQEDFGQLDVQCTLRDPGEHYEYGQVYTAEKLRQVALEELMRWCVEQRNVWSG